MAELPFTSVVTPVYNGAAFLGECIESVLAQTHRNFEFVILDNASTDDTNRIATRYAGQDRRIRLHRNDSTLPVIDNWNRALELISSESRYCRILHADDTIDPEGLAKTVALAERYPSIGIVGSLRRRGDRIQCEGLPRDKEFFPGAEIVRLFLREEVYALAPTSNLLRADLVRDRRPFYPQEYLHADLAVYFDLLRDRDFGFVHEVLAFSRVHEGSITVTIAERDQTILKEWLLMLQRYGPHYFSAEELQALERSFLRRYYRRLVRGTVLPNRRAFLRYHLAALKEADRRPRAGDLLAAAWAEFSASVAQPGKLVRHLTAPRRKGS